MYRVQVPTTGLVQPTPIMLPQSPQPPETVQPPQETEPKSKSDLLIELETKMKGYFDVPDNVEAAKDQIYKPELIRIIRDSIKHFKTATCPFSEAQLQQIGIDRGTMPAARPVDLNPVIKWKKKSGLPQDTPRHNKPINKPPVKPFVRGEGAWVPNLNGNKDLSKKEAICKKVRGILNKLTPTNFQKLTEEMFHLKFWSDSVILVGVIDLIFVKAANEPLYVEVYSKLCAAVHDAEVQNVGECSSFYKALFGKCQSEFTTFIKIEPIEIGENASQTEMPAEVKQSRDEYGNRQKLSTLGLIRLISELYHFKVFDNTILSRFCSALLQKCISKAEDDSKPNTVNENMVACFTVLIQSIGPYHSDHVSPDLLPIANFVEILKQFKPVVCARIRFMLLDLEEAAATNFPKRGNNGSKTLDEVKQEYLKEVNEKRVQREAYQLAREVTKYGRKANMLVALENKFKKYFEVAENVAAVKLHQTYDRKLVQIVRDSIKHFKITKCHLSETQLRNLGIDRGTMPAVPTYSLEAPRFCFDRCDFDVKKGSRQRASRKPLVRGKGAWVPNLNGNKDLSKKEAICKKVRGILNKLTPTNFKKLSKELIGYEIWNLGKDLQAVIDLIFVKAVNEPLYVALYAKLCAAVFDAEVKVEKGYRPPFFMFCLFEKCQTVFNGFVSAATGAEKSSVEVLDKPTNHRDAVIGTIRFIAQLYCFKFLNCQTLTPFCKDLIDNCVTKDENNNDVNPRPDNINELLIEASVLLIESTAPYHMNRSSPKQFEPCTFVEQLTPFKEVVSRRVRFRILDLISSAGKEFPTRKATGPKTLNEIKSQLKEEEEQKRLKREAYGRAQRLEKGPGRRRGTKDSVKADKTKPKPRTKKTPAEIAKETSKWLAARKTVTTGKKKDSRASVSSTSSSSLVDNRDGDGQGLILASDSEEIEKLMSTLVDAVAQKNDSEEIENLLSSLVDAAAQENEQITINLPNQFTFNLNKTFESVENHVAHPTEKTLKLSETESNPSKETVTTDTVPPSSGNSEDHCVVISGFAETQLQSELTGSTKLDEAVSLMNLMCTLVEEMDVDVFPTAFYRLGKVDPASGKPKGGRQAGLPQAGPARPVAGPARPKKKTTRPGRAASCRPVLDPDRGNITV